MGGSHLHAADVNRQHSGEEKHLEEEIGHQTDHSEQTELLHKKKQQRLFAIGNCMTTTTKNRSYTCYLEELHLNCWYKCEVSNEDDAQFSGHILHDRPALIA